MRHDVSCTRAMEPTTLYFLFHLELNHCTYYSFAPEASEINAVLRIPPLHVGMLFGSVHPGYAFVSADVGGHVGINYRSFLSRTCGHEGFRYREALLFSTSWRMYFCKLGLEEDI